MTTGVPPSRMGFVREGGDPVNAWNHLKNSPEHGPSMINREVEAMSFALKSTAFSNGSEIPRKYTCAGENVSPALSWSDVPPQARALALIADDPDAPAGTWTHWVMWNIPAHATSLSEGVAPSQESLPDGARQGKNDFGRIGYGGPCPPPGRPHRYFFRLYALSAMLDVKPGAARSELESAMKPHVVGQAEWMGLFKR